ncbi:hypothetical protein GCM10020331_022660 [Ectobacillus funiculus]
MAEEDMNDTLARITPVLTIQSAAEADLVIEAAVERMDIKKQIFLHNSMKLRQLGQFLRLIPHPCRSLKLLLRQRDRNK